MWTDFAWIALVCRSSIRAQRARFPGQPCRKRGGAREAAEGEVRDCEERSRKFAKQLRQEMTGAEIILWSRLKRGQLAGRKFRRQHPVGPYIADFVCLKACTIVEADGAAHSTDAEREHDRRREQYLRKSGWKVLRVHNEDVYKRLSDVLNLICLEVPPHRPSAGPPQQAREERERRDIGVDNA